MREVTRKAILIGCPGEGDGFLSGVQLDLMNVSAFLQSEKGGVWFPNEISSFYNPSQMQLAQAIENAIADYVFVYFSGHGYTDWDAKTRMICFENFVLSDGELLNKSIRQLVLIDACRNEVRPSISGIPDNEPQWDYFDLSPVREYFDKQIENSPAGKLIIHGTQSGQSSYDSNAGGYFTNALLHIGTRIRADRDYSRALISDVIKYVPKVLETKAANNQVPCIVYRNGNLQVPFAVGIPKYDLQKAKPIPKPQQMVPLNSNSSNGWLALMLLAIGVAALNSK